MEKITPPLKTRIAAWWMIVIGVLGTILSSFLKVDGRSFSDVGLVVGSFSGLFAAIPGCFLLRRKRWAWWLGTINLSIISILFFISGYFFDFSFGGAYMLPFGIALLLLVSFLPIVFLSVFQFFLSYLYPILGYSINWFLIIIPIFPLIFLLLDRKNFWEISS